MSVAGHLEAGPAGIVGDRCADVDPDACTGDDPQAFQPGRGRRFEQPVVTVGQPQQVRRPIRMISNHGEVDVPGRHRVQHAIVQSR